MKQKWKKVLMVFLTFCMLWNQASAQGGKFIQIDGGFGLRDDGTVWKLPVATDKALWNIFPAERYTNTDEVKMTKIQECVNVKKISAYFDFSLTSLDVNGVATSYASSIAKTYLKPYRQEYCRMEQVKDISSGDTATLFVKENGSVWIWGMVHNKLTIEGDNSKHYGNTSVRKYIFEPQQIKNISNPKSLFASFYNGVGFINENGERLLLERQLIDGSYDAETAQYEAKLFPSDQGIKFQVVDAGQGFMISILENGSVYIDDYIFNESIDHVIDVDAGEILQYNPHFNSRNEPTYYSNYYYPHYIVLKEDGTVWESGCLFMPPTEPSDKGLPETLNWYPIRGLDHVVDIDALNGYILALKDDGTIIKWGPQPQIVSTDYPQPLNGRYCAVWLTVQDSYKHDASIMYFNDEICEIDPGRGTKPIERNGRTYLPIRNLVEKAGGSVEWNAETETVTARLWNHEVKMRLGSAHVKIDGEGKIIDAVPFEEYGRTMVPIRFLAEGFGFDVEWDETSQSVRLYYKELLQS